MSTERADRMRGDLEKVEQRLDEEKKRSSELLEQVILFINKQNAKDE